VSGTKPPTLNSSSTSKNWPCTCVFFFLFCFISRHHYQSSRMRTYITNDSHRRGNVVHAALVQQHVLQSLAQVMDELFALFVCLFGNVVVLRLHGRQDSQIGVRMTQREREREGGSRTNSSSRRTRSMQSSRSTLGIALAKMTTCLFQTAAGCRRRHRDCPGRRVRRAR